MLPTRRAVLTGALSAGLLAGCTGESPIQTPDPDRDEALVTEILAAQQGLIALVDASASGRPKRVEALAPTREVHVAHVGLLDTAASTTPVPTGPFAPSHRAAYRAVAVAEDTLAQTLRTAAGAAQSGSFARVLASMAAASAQQAARLRGLA